MCACACGRVADGDGYVDACVCVTGPRRRQGAASVYVVVTQFVSVISDCLCDPESERRSD